MSSALLFLALATSPFIHAEAVDLAYTPERLERLARTTRIEVDEWTLDRERWAAERLASRGTPAPTAGAWDRLSSEDRKDLALREAIEAEVDREVASVRYFGTRAPRPLTIVDEMATTHLMEIFFAKARSPGAEIDREWARLSHALKILAGHTITLTSTNGTMTSNVRETRALDEVIETQGEVLGRLIVRAVDFHYLGRPEEASRSIAAALNVILRAHLLMGANSGSFNKPKHIFDFRSVIKNLENLTVEIADRFNTLENLKDAFWLTALPYFQATEPWKIEFANGPFADARFVTASTKPKDIGLAITKFLMELSTEPAGTQCDRMLGSIQRDVATSAKAMRGEPR